MSTLKVNNIQSFTGANPVTVSDKLEITGELSGSNSLFASLSLDPDTNAHKTVLYDTSDGKFYYTGSYVTSTGTQGTTGTQGVGGVQGLGGTQGVGGVQGLGGNQGTTGTTGASSVPFTELKLRSMTNATSASISGSGTIYFNSDTNAFYGYNGSNHLKFTTVTV